MLSKYERIDHLAIKASQREISQPIQLNRMREAPIWP